MTNVSVKPNFKTFLTIYSSCYTEWEAVVSKSTVFDKLHSSWLISMQSWAVTSLFLYTVIILHTPFVFCSSCQWVGTKSNSDTMTRTAKVKTVIASHSCLTGSRGSALSGNAPNWETIFQSNSKVNISAVSQQGWNLGAQFVSGDLVKWLNHNGK